MGGKKGGGARTPNIEKNTLHSAQKIKVVDLVSSGEIFGFVNGNDDPLKSIYLNGTPIQNNDGSLNFSGVRAEYNNGAEDQDYLPSFTSSDRSIEVAARVKKDVPVTRTVYNKQVTSLRVTVGVDALMRSTKEGDQLKTSVSMTVSLIKDGNYYASKPFNLDEKGSKPFYHDLVFDDLPEAPFDIKCTRNTPDSNDDLLRNDTYFFSYVESIDVKMRYPLSSVVGLEVDSAQFGNNLPVRTYGIKGCEVLVPSNYDPVTREYSGLWDRLFKPAYTNNPVWVLYDLLTNPIDGFGGRDLKIDIDKFYEASKYCDELVDDGNGNKEPRFVCNAVIQGGKAYEIINNVCSSFRAVPAYNGEYFTIYYDRAHDTTAIYNNSNVVDGLFTYSSTDRTEQYNQVQVQFADEENGYETTIEEVADDRHIAKHGINTLSIVAFGATKRSYALRNAWWNLVTNLTEKEIVTFKVGAQGIKHEIYDIIQIADNDYVGENMGARIADINGAKITLDRDIENVKKLVIDTKDGIKTFDVKRQLSERELELTIAPSIVESAVCTAILDHVNARLFRCTSIAENDDGTFTITAIQHNAQKEAIVDKGATYIPENSTTINPTPSLSNGVADNDGRAIILRWDAMTVIGADNTYRVQLFKDKVLYQTFETKETFLELENLPQGEYVAKIRAVNSNGQHSAELVIAFSTTYKIDGLRARPIVFGIELHWQLPALITTDAHTEIWYSDVDDRTQASKLSVLTYPQNSYTLNGLSVGDELYFWFRLVDSSGNQGEFTHSIKGRASDNADDILGYLQGQITTKELSPEVVGDIIEDIKEDVDDIIADSEVISSLNEKAGESEIDSKLLELSKITSDSAIYAETQTNRVSIEDNYAEIILQKLTEATNNKQLASQYLSLVAENERAKAELLLFQIAQTTDNKAFAQEVLSLTASFLESSASINEIKEVTADIDGTVKSQYTLTTETVGADGQKIVSGFTSLNDGKSSEFVIQADRFAVINKQNGETKMPFVLTDNKLALDGDMIATGSISGNKIVAGTEIQAPIVKGGRVESGHFAGGSLDIGNGNCTIQENGDFYAKNGKFEGTVYAEKIVGDVVDFEVLTVNSSGYGSMAISPANYNREILMPPMSIRAKSTSWSSSNSYAVSIVDIRVGSFLKSFRTESLQLGITTGANSNYYTSIPTSKSVNVKTSIKAGETAVVSISSRQFSMVNGKETGHENTSYPLGDGAVDVPFLIRKV